MPDLGVGERNEALSRNGEAKAPLRNNLIAGSLEGIDSAVET